MDGIFPKVRRIIAIGDVHGDIQALKKILERAGLIEESGLWIGRDTYVVQIGDQMDGLSRMGNWRNDNEMEVIIYMTELDGEAKKYNGRVLSLIGNHELMNTMGDFSYVSQNGMSKFGGTQNRMNLLKPGGKIALLFAKSRYAVIKIGEWVFVHGGIKPEISREYSIPQINRNMRAYMTGKLTAKQRKDFAKIFDNNDSIVYYRGFSNDRPNCRGLDESLNNMHCKKMVVGHSVQDRINSKCGERVWRIDTGISRAFGSGRDQKKRSQYMEIIDGYIVRNH